MTLEQQQQISPETTTAFQDGYIVVYDIKDGMDLRQDDAIEECPEAFDVCAPLLFQNYTHQVDEEDPQGRRLMDIESKEDLEEGFQEMATNYMFFRISHEYRDSSLEDVLALCRERSFWQPWYVIRKGELVDLPTGSTVML